MKRPKNLKLVVSKTVLAGIALLVLAFSGSVLAHGDETENTSDKKKNYESSSTDKKQLESSRENAKLRLEGDKLKACENREKAINNILDRIAKRGERRLNVYNSIFERVQAFYEKKNLSVSNYDELVADVKAKKAAAEEAVKAAGAKEVDFKCDGSDPKGVA